MLEPISRKTLCLIAIILLAPIFAIAQSALININTAASALLQTLNGIGVVKAQAIIDYRTANGPFQAIEDIQNVSGIGPATYNNIKDFITIGAATPPVVDNTSNSMDNISSVHYSSTPVTNVDKRVDVYVSAGKDRLGTAGSPMEFMAETDFEYTKSNIFSWNFGDGSQGVGNIAAHTYEYPGEYVAVLNASLPQAQAVSRVNVKIVEPEIEIISASSERIELKNHSKSEINLYGRALWSNNKIFLFPKDTIVRAGQSVSFSSRITELSPNNQHDVQIMVAGDTEQPKLMAKIEEEKAKKIIQLQTQISSLWHQMASITSLSLPAQSPEFSEPQSPEPQTAAVINIKSGWLETLKRFFLR